MVLTAGGGGAPISGATVTAAVIGDPVRHSLSPAIHNAGFAAAGLDWVYVALPVPDGKGAAAVEAMRILRLGGLSVTMPHKEVVVAAADERSDAVERLGAANCLVPLGDGRIRAENTDGPGFVAGLAADAGVEPAGRRFVVFGAGGASRAIVAAVADAGADEVVVVNRTNDRALVAAELAGSAGRVGSVDDVGAADVVVNATSLGMGGAPDMPCPSDLLHRGQVVVDAVYGPRPTRWLVEARGAGIDAHDGLSMLVHQAAVAFRHWTGVAPPVDAMRAAAMASSGINGS